MHEAIQTNMVSLVSETAQKELAIRLYYILNIDSCILYITYAYCILHIHVLHIAHH